MQQQFDKSMKRQSNLYLRDLLRSFIDKWKNKIDTNDKVKLYVRKAQKELHRLDTEANETAWSYVKQIDDDATEEITE